jgi:hypothetical protein
VWAVAFGMGDEGGGMAIFGGNLDLLVDHRTFLSVSGFQVFCLARRFDTIARKLGHDKATCTVRSALNRAVGIAIV